MSATATSRAVICSRCGDATGEYTDGPPSRVGPCCQNLPGLYEIDPNTGRFTRSADDPIEDDEEPAYPCCSRCGCTEFRATSTEIVAYNHRVSFDGDDLVVGEGDDPDYEGRDRGSVICVNCGHVYVGDVAILWS